MKRAYFGGYVSLTNTEKLSSIRLVSNSATDRDTESHNFFYVLQTLYCFVSANFAVSDTCDNLLPVRVQPERLESCINGSTNLAENFHNNILKTSVVNQHGIQ